MKPQRKAARERLQSSLLAAPQGLRKTEMVAANGGGGRKGDEGWEGRRGGGGTDVIQHTETCQDGIYFCSVREYNRALPALSIAVLK